VATQSSPADGAEALRGYFTAIASLDPERIAGCLCQDGELEDPIGTGVRHGRDEIREYWAQGLCAVVVAVDIDIIALLPAGRSVASHWQMSARTCSGVLARAEGMDVLQLDPAGLIQRAEGYWDQMAFRAALMNHPGSRTS
jgi:hypothetical protein